MQSAYRRSPRRMTTVAIGPDLSAAMTSSEGANRTWAATSMTTAAAGVFVIAVGYAIGRGGHTLIGNCAFWCGYGLIFVPLLFGVSRNRPFTHGDSLTVLTVVTVISFLTKWMYAPLRLKFPDELQHLRGLQNARSTGHIGGRNLSLTVAERFPGLSSLGSTVANATHLPLEATTFVVAALLHVMICVAVYVLFGLLLATYRSVAIAVIVYSANGGFLSYSSDYVYQNLAFPFFVLGLISLVKIYRSPAQAQRWFAVAIICEAFCLLSHHLTAIALALTLLLAGAMELAGGDQRSRRLVLALGVLAPLLCIMWLFCFASPFFHYLSQYFAHQSSPNVTIFMGQEATSIGRAPLLNIAFALASVGIVGVGVVIGIMNRRVLLIAYIKVPILVLGSALFVSLSVRALLPSGSEVLIRSEPFIYCAGAAILGAIFGSPNRDLPSAEGAPPGARAKSITAHLSSSSPTFVVIAATLLIGGVCGAWPAWWLRVPQGFVESGFERGVDAHINNAAAWVAANLPKGGRVAADTNGEIALSTRGGQQLVADVGLIFYTPTINSQTLQLIRSEHVSYVWVDSRLPSLLSADGTYFPGVDVAKGLRPPADALNKFGSASDVSKLYDDGTIAIYDLRALA